MLRTKLSKLADRASCECDKLAMGPGSQRDAESFSVNSECRSLMPQLLLLVSKQAKRAGLFFLSTCVMPRLLVACAFCSHMTFISLEHQFLAMYFRDPKPQLPQIKMSQNATVTLLARGWYESSRDTGTLYQQPQGVRCAIYCVIVHVTCTPQALVEDVVERPTSTCPGCSYLSECQRSRPFFPSVPQKQRPCTMWSKHPAAWKRQVRFSVQLLSSPEHN